MNNPLGALAIGLGDGKMQWIAITGIVVFATLAFTCSNKYSHKALGLAGDSLDVNDVKVVFDKTTMRTVVQTTRY